MPFPVSTKYIEEAEKELNTVFPKSYSDKMQKDNGGEIETSNDIFWLYPFFDTSDKKRLKRTFNSNVRETKTFREYFPQFENYIAIAHNGSGDYLVFENDNGIASDSVFYFNHETNQRIEIAKDFAELLD